MIEKYFYANNFGQALCCLIIFSDLKLARELKHKKIISKHTFIFSHNYIKNSTPVEKIKKKKIFLVI